MPRDIPIIFSAPMVRALLDGRKTQTRRLASSPLAKVQAGDRLWVRENIEIQGRYTDGVRVVYEASRERGGSEAIALVSVPLDTRVPVCPGKLRPSIHMPRWASRLTLVVEEVRFQRLYEISEADAQAEGATSRPKCAGFRGMYDGWSMDWSSVGQPSKFAPDGKLTERCISLDSPRMAFANLWIQLHGEASWDAGPEVVALTFHVVRANIDTVPIGAAA